MSMYDSTDLASAEFARHPDGWRAIRLIDSEDFMAFTGIGGVRYTGASKMAALGWAPVMECPDLEQHDDRYVSPLAVKRVQEVQARAEKAERERDEARADAESLSRQLYDAQQDADMYRAELEGEPRPLTPDAITDEMVDRAFRATIPHPAACVSEAVIREMLAAALTEPPARPEWVGKAGVVWASARGHRHVLWQTDDDGAHWEHDGQSVDWFVLSDVTPLYPEGVRAARRDEEKQDG